MTARAQVYPAELERKKAYLALLTTAAIWGVALPIAKVSFEETTPMVFLFYRYLFAVITSLPLMIIFREQIKFRLKHLPELVTVGIFSTLLAHWLLYAGLQKSTSIEGSLITALIPVLVIAGGAYFLREKVTRIEKWGTLLALIGSIVIIFEPIFLNSQKLSLSHTLGNAAIFAYNLSFTVSILWMKKIAGKYNPFSICFVSFLVGLVGFFTLAYGENPHFLTINYFKLPHALFASFYMGTLGSVVAFYLYQYGQRRIEASEAVLFSYLSSIFAIPLAVFWLGEKLTLPIVIGSTIIVIGIYLAEKRWKKKTVRRHVKRKIRLPRI